MKIKTQIKSIVVFGALSASFISSAHKPVAPNIIIILADDMGYSDIGCYGSEINTPNIDRLAQEGVKFTQFYNSARCCPTRASLLTGMYHHKTGMGGMTNTNIELPAYQGYLNNECMTFGEIFKSAGYKTYLSGKWHVGDKKESWPVNRGFDNSFSLISGATDYFDPYMGNYDALRLVIDSQKYIPHDPEFYLTDAFSDYAHEYIDEHQDRYPETPFLLYLSYTAPHWPLQALPEDILRYEDTYKIGWDSIRVQRFKKMRKSGVIDENVKLSERHNSVPPWSSLKEKEKNIWSQKMAVYAAMIDRMDQGIGKLLDLLDQKGVADNTIVIFLADNGGCMEDAEKFGVNIEGSDPGGPGSFIGYEAPWANVSNTPFRYFKSWMHEGGIATPFIMKYPGKIEKNSIRNASAHIIDIVPTLMEYAQIEYPDKYEGNNLKPLDGKSFLSVIHNNETSQHDALFWEHLGYRAVRSNDWKIVSTYPDNIWELYNLEVDRSETVDLSNDFPCKVEELEKKYLKWAKKSNVKPWKDVKKFRRKNRK